MSYTGDWVLHQAVDRNAWLEANVWALGAVTVVLAGLYQVTPLKYYCLDKCRSPLSFPLEYWHGRHDRAQAFRLSVHHGLFCIGCCWLLMLLMFAVGAGSLGGMLALTTVMVIEKICPGAGGSVRRWVYSYLDGAGFICEHLALGCGLLNKTKRRRASK